MQFDCIERKHIAADSCYCFVRLFGGWEDDFVESYFEESGGEAGGVDCE